MCLFSGKIHEQLQQFPPSPPCTAVLSPTCTSGYSWARKCVRVSLLHGSWEWRECGLSISFSCWCHGQLLVFLVRLGPESPRQTGEELGGTCCTTRRASSFISLQTPLWSPPPGKGRQGGCASCRDTHTSCGGRSQARVSAELSETPPLGEMQARLWCHSREDKDFLELDKDQAREKERGNFDSSFFRVFFFFISRLPSGRAIGFCFERILYAHG